MVKSVNGSLVLLDMNTRSPKAFLNGNEITGVVAVSTHYILNKKNTVLLILDNTTNANIPELNAAGIKVEMRR